MNSLGPLLLGIVGLWAGVAWWRVMADEARRNRAFVDQMKRIGRRCPACQPWGGWYLGKMREDGSYETHTCDLCGGTGELAERPNATGG